MPDAPRSAVGRSAPARPAPPEADTANGPDESAGPTAPGLSMLADDGAACVDGVCALPDPVTP